MSAPRHLDAREGRRQQNGILLLEGGVSCLPKPQLGVCRNGKAPRWLGKHQPTIVEPPNCQPAPEFGRGSFATICTLRTLRTMEHGQTKPKSKSLSTCSGARCEEGSPSEALGRRRVTRSNVRLCLLQGRLERPAILELKPAIRSAKTQVWYVKKKWWCPFANL